MFKGLNTPSVYTPSVTFEKELEFDRKEFISSLERIAVLADQHNNVIKVTTDGSANLIKISTDAQDIGTGYESLPVSYKGDSFQIAFNVRYLFVRIEIELDINGDFCCPETERLIIQKNFRER